jgi:hypothetical protein
MQIRLFGLLLAILVCVNFVLAVTWIPVSTICWERYLDCCTNPCDACNDEADDDNDTAEAMRRARPAEDDTSSLECPFSTPAGFTTSTVPTSGKAFAHPKPGVMHNVPIKSEALARSTRCWFLDGRFIWRHVFSLVYSMRFLCVLGLLGVSVYGGILASRLKPASSLPKLFHDSHNVQEFINIWGNNFTDDSLFACPSCLRNTVSLGELDSTSAQSIGALPSGTSSTDATVGSGGNVSTVAHPGMPPSAAANASDSGSFFGPAGAQASGGAAAPDAAPLPLLPPTATSSTASNSTQAMLDRIPINPADLTVKRVNKNTIPVSVMWGIKGVQGGSDKRTDSFAISTTDVVTFDESFDPGSAEQQRVIVQQVCL